MNSFTSAAKVCLTRRCINSPITSRRIDTKKIVGGGLLISGIMHLTRVYDGLVAIDNTLVQTKLNDTWYSVLILAFMCGIMIYLGVENFGRSNNNFSKVFGLVICVFVFIICSFEHSIADMFYFVFADSFSWKTFGYILLIILGNSLGGCFIPAILLLKDLTEKKNDVK